MHLRFIFFLSIAVFAVKAHAQSTSSNTATTTVKLNAAVNVKASENGLVIKLYPNPADKYVNIYVDQPTAQSFTLSLYDTFGALIKEQQVDEQKSYQYNLDVSQLPNGKYKVQVKGNASVVSQDLTIQH